MKLAGCPSRWCETPLNCSGRRSFQRFASAPLVSTVIQTDTTLHTGLWLDAPEEVDHRSIDFLRPLLLSPVTTARKHERPLEVGDELRQIGNKLVHTAEGHHQVPVSGDVERRHGHTCPG